MKTKNNRYAVFLAILAAALYAINVPLSKLLLVKVQPTVTSSFLYLGAGVGMLVYTLAAMVLMVKDTLSDKNV